MSRQWGDAAGATLAVLWAAACGGAAGGGGGWEARVDTVGDTITVHTVSGSERGRLVLRPDVRIGRLEGADHEILGSVTGLAEDAAGNIYLYDQQVPALRKYGPDGTFLANIGRQGGGPGEYANSDGGMAVLPDGRLVLRDPGNARYTLYRTDGSFDSEWTGRGGFFTSSPLVVDTAGHAWGILIRQPADGEEPWPSRLWVTDLLRMRLDGTPLDTVTIPRYDFEAKEIVATRENSTSVNNVPFTGSFHWAIHPHGGLLTAIGDRLAVDWHRPDGTVLRFSRDAEPVPVAAGEKEEAEANATRNMRSMVPDWRWNGPAIPDTKAPVREVYAGRDGRIWVQVATAAEAIPESERDIDPAAPPDAPPPPRYRAPIAFDVFEPDGRYIGRVATPRGFSPYPQPVFDRDHVWAVLRDELDVNYVVRFAIVADSVAG